MHSENIIANHNAPELRKDRSSSVIYRRNWKVCSNSQNKAMHNNATSIPATFLRVTIVPG